MSRHITKITSNVKKGVDIELGPKTLIVGPNGSGKTSTINSIELALCQQVTDLIGREVVKRPADIIKLTNDKDLSVECILSDGHEIKVSTSRTKTGATKPKVKGKLEDAQMPYYEVRSSLSGSPEVAREWLMSKGLGSNITRDEVLTEMDQNYHSLYKRSAARKRRSEMEILKGAISTNGDALKNCRDEIRALERAVEHGEGLIHKTVTKTHLSKAEKEEKEWREALRSAESQSTHRLHLQVETDALGKRVQNLITQVESIEKEYDVAVTAAQLSPQVSEVDQTVLRLAESVVGAASWNVNLSRSACVVCDTDKGCNFFQERVASMQQQSASVREAMEWHSKAETLGQALQDVHTSAKVTIQKWTEKKAELTQLTPLASLDELRTGWSESKKKLDDLRILSQQLERVHQDRKSLASRKENLDLLKGYGTELKRVSAVLLNAAKDNFVSQVQSFLPAKYEFQMKLGEKACLFGFQNGVGLKTALSGAEWASMIMALSNAAAADSEDIVVITPEERAFDPDTLSVVMESMTEGKHQIILTSTVPPTSVPEGWTVVTLS